MTAEENNLPIDLQHPGGFVEETMTWINETAVCPQPIFALASALCLAGTIFGRHVQDESGQRTNLYLMGVGYTSCGKDHALKAVARALDACEASGLRLGQVTSDSAVEYALRREPRFAMLIDEAGHFFANVSNAKTFGSPLQSLKPALLELWSCANSRWKGKQRVPKNEREAEPVLIDNDPERVRYVSDQLDCMVLEVVGNNHESLEAAGISSPDAYKKLVVVDRDRPDGLVGLDDERADVLEAGFAHDVAHVATKRLAAAVFQRARNLMTSANLSGDVKLTLAPYQLMSFAAPAGSTAHLP